MHNIKLTLACDGTEFHGWQIQPGRPTIQGVLTETLQKITQQTVTLNGASRTDAGVHAWGQVANFSTSSELTPGELARALNALLPAVIRVRAADEVEPGFHARWDAVAKTYIYRIYRARVLPPFHWRYVHHDCSPLDFAAMSEAASVFVGDHDFTSFAASSGSPEVDQDRLMQRTIYQSEMLACGHGLPSPGLPLHDLPFAVPAPDEWVYAVRGKSFLRHMVRKMVGALIEAGRGRLQPTDIPGLLAARDRTQSGPTVPAQGLYLVSVEYPDPTNLLKR